MAQLRSPSMPSLTLPTSPHPHPHTYVTQHEPASEQALRSFAPSPIPSSMVKPSTSPPRTPHPRQFSFHPSRSSTQSARSLSAKPQPTTSTRYLAHDSKGTLAPLTETIRRPIMYQGKYGSPGNWALDPFTLPHNAIRAECVDLYNILESIHVRAHPVHLHELEEFYKWWTIFEIFIIEYFDFEADVLFPWVFAATASQHNLTSELSTEKFRAEVLLRNSLLSKKEVILDDIRKLNGTFELCRNVDTADVFQTILDEVNQFVPKLLEYFHIEERHLPPIVEWHYSASSKEMILKRYLQYIKKGENPHVNLVLLSRWMDADVKGKWLRSNIRGLTRILHRRWERRCDKTHSHIAYKFHRRLLRSVRSVAASRLRRRTEFGEDVDDISFSSFASQTGSIRSLNLGRQSRASAFARYNRRSKEGQKSRLKIK